MSNIDRMFEWMAKMQTKYHVSVIADVETNEIYDLGQALARECYGPNWNNSPRDEPTDADMERANRWLAGEWPKWARKPQKKVTKK